MKKFATMLLALLLTAALTVPAMATFTPSSENKDAPEIISATFEDGTDAKGYLIVTPYSKRDSADPSIKESLERAYEDVKNASTLDKLNSDVNTLLKNYPHVKAEDLVASDLFDLSYVENGQLAVERFEQASPGEFDAILMDVQMPVLDGRAATRALRALDRSDATEIPIFALSADAFIEDERLSMESGMNGHYSKPIDFIALRRNVGAYLRRKETR